MGVAVFCCELLHEASASAQSKNKHSIYTNRCLLPGCREHIDFLPMYSRSGSLFFLNRRGERLEIFQALLDMIVEQIMV